MLETKKTEMQRMIFDWILNGMVKKKKKKKKIATNNIIGEGGENERLDNNMHQC